jgi:hypothetical protein
VFRKLATRHAEAAKRIASKAHGIREEMENSAIIEAPLTAHPELAFGRWLLQQYKQGARRKRGQKEGPEIALVAFRRLLSLSGRARRVSTLDRSAITVFCS